MNATRTSMQIVGEWESLEKTIIDFKDEGFLAVQIPIKETIQYKDGTKKVINIRRESHLYTFKGLAQFNSIILPEIKVLLLSALAELDEQTQLGMRLDSSLLPRLIDLEIRWDSGFPRLSKELGSESFFKIQVVGIPTLKEALLNDFNEATFYPEEDTVKDPHPDTQIDHPEEPSYYNGEWLDLKTHIQSYVSSVLKHALHEMIEIGKRIEANYCPLPNAFFKDVVDNDVLKNTQSIVEEWAKSLFIQTSNEAINTWTNFLSGKAYKAEFLVWYGGNARLHSLVDEAKRSEGSVRLHKHVSIYEVKKAITVINNKGARSESHLYQRVPTKEKKFLKRLERLFKK